MHRATAHAYKLLQYLQDEFGFITCGLAIAFTIYAALYLLSLRTSARFSLRGLGSYLFPSEAFRDARIDSLAYVIQKLACAPLLAKILGLLAFQSMTLRLLNVFFGARLLTPATSWLVLLMQFLVFYFASNLAFYWAHRAMHQNKLLWSIHRPHHSAEALTFLTGGRVHPIESIGVGLWTTFWTGSAAAVLSYYSGAAIHPLMPAAVLGWLILTDVLDKIQHSHLSTSLGPLDYIIASGAMHQIHHSAELKHRDKNFGNASSIFDWLFGTIYIPAPRETIRLGLSEQELGAQNPHKCIRDIYAEPIAYAWCVLRGAKSREPVGSSPGITRNLA